MIWLRITSMLLCLLVNGNLWKCSKTLKKITSMRLKRTLLCAHTIHKNEEINSLRSQFCKTRPFWVILKHLDLPLKIVQFGRKWRRSFTPQMPFIMFQILRNFNGNHFLRPFGSPFFLHKRIFGKSLSRVQWRAVRVTKQLLGKGVRPMRIISSV